MTFLLGHGRPDRSKKFAEMEAELAAVKLRLAAMEARLADLERRMRMSPKLIAEIEAGARQAAAQETANDEPQHASEPTAPTEVDA